MGAAGKPADDAILFERFLLHSYFEFVSDFVLRISEFPIGTGLAQRDRAGDSRVFGVAGSSFGM
jgi:hypothetical protein